MRIDLHVHTRERSSCAHSSAEEMVRAAVHAGLDGMVISDHDRLVPPEVLNHLNAKYAPFRVFGGVEITAREEHILVLGVHDAALERMWWSYSDLYTFVEERNGFLAVAHPYRFTSDRVGVDVNRYPPHALEVYSRNTPRSAAPRIRGLANELGIPLLSNSDGHHVSDLGRYYNVFDHRVEDIDTLVAMLKRGAFEPIAPTQMAAGSA